MKRWLFFLLAFLVVAGSVTPCFAADSCQDEITTTTAKAHNNKETDEGTCSPFFSCGSCTGFVQLAKQINVSILVVECSLHYQKLISDYSSNYYSYFFKPPRKSSFIN